MTMTLELPEDIQRELRSLAERTQATDEDIALAALREYLEHRVDRDIDTVDGEPSTLSDEQFAQVAQGVVRDYREVLERLAR